MDYNLQKFSPVKFYELKDLDRLEKFYYKVIDIENEITDKLWQYIDKFDRQYLTNLVHEGRSNASTAISSLSNLRYYESHPETGHNIKHLRHQMYHFFLLFSIYMQSLVIYYNEVYLKGDKLK